MTAVTILSNEFGLEKEILPRSCLSAHSTAITGHVARDMRAALCPKGSEPPQIVEPIPHVCALPEHTHCVKCM